MSEMSRLETEMLSSKKNLMALMDLPGRWIDFVHECVSLHKPILDSDGWDSATHGERSLPRSAEAGWTKSGVQGQVFSPESPESLEMGLARQ